MSITGTKPPSSRRLEAEQNLGTDYLRAFGQNSAIPSQSGSQHTDVPIRTHRSNIITSPPKPTYTDTSVNVANAFYQAAAAQMAPTAWNSTTKPTSRVGRGSVADQDKENRHQLNGQKPLSKASVTGSVALISDSEPEEEELDAKGRPLSKGSNTGIRSSLSRALSPAAFYVRERSRDIEESNQSLHVPRSLSRESSYDYTTEQAHYENLLNQARARRASEEPPGDRSGDKSLETEGANTSKSTVKKHRSRISIDNQAWKPGKDDLNDDEDYDSDSGKKRRKKKKKDETAGRLTNLPTVDYGKKRKGRKSGPRNPETIEEVDESSFGNETSEMVTGDSSLFPQPPLEEPSLTEEPFIKELPPISSIPAAVIEEVRAPNIRKRSRSRSRSAPPEPARPRRPAFSPGAVLGSLIRYSTLAVIRTLAFFWQVLIFLVKTPLGIVLMTGLSATAIYYFSIPLPELPFIPFTSNLFSWAPYRVYHAPDYPAETVQELVQRLSKAENALTELTKEFSLAQDSLVAELKVVHQQANRIAFLETRLEGEVKRNMDIVDATRQSSGQSIQALRAELSTLKDQLAKTPSGNPELEKQLQHAIQTLEGRMELAETSVRDALEYVKRGSKVNTRGKSSVVIKTSDGKDVSDVIGELVDDAISLFSQDAIGKADFALYSAGGRILPSLTTPSYEIRPSGWFSYILGYPFGRGFAQGRPPVTSLHPDLSLGHCWSFAGSRGQLAIVLARSIHISEITIDHARPTFDSRSAPKTIGVWGFIEGADNLEKYQVYRELQKERRAQEVLDGQTSEPEPTFRGGPRGVPFLHLATVTYDVHAPSHIQTFQVPQEIQDLGIDIGVIVFDIQDNWGDDEYTCLYRVRVHGTEKDGPPPLLPEEPSS